MTGELRIDGQLVATLDLAGSYSRPRDHVMIFRSASDWSVLSVSRYERYDDDGNLASSDALASATVVDDLAGLEQLAERRGWTWWEILDAIYDADPEAYAAWVPERMRRDLDAASIYNKDLATAAGYFGPQVPAPGKAIPGWQAEATAAMAVHLEELGWLVRGERLRYRRRHKPGDDPVLGVLEAWRYGYAAAVVVRVDCCGEIFARLPDEDDVDGPVLRQLSEAEDDELGDELRRRRYEAIDAQESRECECPRTWASVGEVADLDHPIVLHEENCPRRLGPAT